MAWFYYGDQPKRSKRKGICLRVGSLDKDVVKKIQANVKEDEWPWMVKVNELRPNNQVLLEVWCHQNIGKAPDLNKPERYTVFHLLVDENPKWVCESDLGRGMT